MIGSDICPRRSSTLHELLDPHPHRGTDSGSQTIRLWEKDLPFKGSNPKVFDQAFHQTFAETSILGDPSALRADIDLF